MQRALIGVCAVALLLGCKRPTPKPGAEPHPVPPALTGERDRAVDFVYVHHAEGAKPEARMSPVKVQVRPNPSHQVRVAVNEPHPEAASSLRGSAWMASVLAASTVGRPITDYEFGVSAGDSADGPSAGALTTAAIIAALEDVPVRGDVTLAGTINPDGTVGPVGALIEKLRGAAAKGKKVFGYPLGAPAELGGVAAENHLEAKQVGDLYDAYALLTGRELPRPSPLSPAEMHPAPEVIQRMQAKSSAWISRAQASAELASETAGTAVQESRLVESARSHFEKAVRFQRQGEASAGFVAARQAVAYAELVRHMNRLADLVMEGSLEAAVQALHSQAAVKARVDAFGEELVSVSPKTAREAMALLAAYDAYTLARASIAIGDTQVKGLDRLLSGSARPRPGARRRLAADAVAKAIAPSLRYSVAAELVDGGRALFQPDEPGGRPLKLEQAQLAQLARSYTRAAEVNLEYLESPRAGGAHLRPRSGDLDDRLARTLAAQALEDARREDLPHALMSLAAAQQSYLLAAKLVARDYSLQMHRDAHGELAGGEQALGAMLELAEAKAREQAGEAKKVSGLVPVTAQDDYEAANAKRSGDPEERLDALADYWSASQASQLVVLLTRLSAPSVATAKDGKL